MRGAPRDRVCLPTLPERGYYYQHPPPSNHTAVNMPEHTHPPPNSNTSPQLPNGSSASRLNVYSPPQRPPYRSRSSTVSSVASDASSVLIEPEPAPPKSWKDRYVASKPILLATGQFAALFVVSLVVLYVAIKMLLPPVKPDEAAKLKLPKSFDDLKDLNDVLQIYKQSNFYRVLSSFVLVYLFLQCFSVPGSMYLSMIGGALFGLWALPLVCFCIASGASLCYIMSQLLGPALLVASAKWRNRVDKWKDRIQSHQANLISYLIVLRIAPLPPHWVVNLIAPHLGISFWMFWASTFLGVCGVSFIHVQLGMTLDDMTSSDDFHLVTFKNFLGLAGIVVAVLVPVGIRYVWASDIKDAAADEEVGEIALPQSDTESAVPASAQRPNPRKFGPASRLVFLDREGRDLPSREQRRGFFPLSSTDDAQQQERKSFFSSSTASGRASKDEGDVESIQLKESPPKQPPT